MFILIRLTQHVSGIIIPIVRRTDYVNNCMKIIKIIGIQTLYLNTDFRWLQIHTSRICNNELKDVILIKFTVTRFMRTGCFLSRYFNGHTK